MTPLEADVLRLLRIETTIADLTILVGVPRRVIEETVEALRLAGEPIIGGAAGLRLTEDPDALDAYLRQRGRRTARIHRGTMRLRSTARHMRESQDERAGLTLFGTV